MKVRIVSLRSTRETEEEDKAYWKSRTSEERLNAVEVLRQQYYKIRYKEKAEDESSRRLRRVLRIVKQK